MLTIEDFLKEYRFVFYKKTQNEDIVFTTEIVNRKTGENYLFPINISININKLEDWLNIPSVFSWTMDKVIDDVKRHQLDYFAQCLSIDNFFPLDRKTNTNIDNLYK